MSAAISSSPFNFVQKLEQQANSRLAASCDIASKASYSVTVLKVGQRIVALAQSFFLALGCCFQTYRVSCKEAFLQACTGRRFEAVVASIKNEPDSNLDEKLVKGPIVMPKSSEVKAPEPSDNPLIDSSLNRFVNSAATGSTSSMLAGEMEKIVESESPEKASSVISSTTLELSTDPVVVKCKSIYSAFRKKKGYTPEIEATRTSFKASKKATSTSFKASKDEFIALDIARYIGEAAGLSVKEKTESYYSLNKKTSVPIEVNVMIEKINSASILEEKVALGQIVKSSGPVWKSEIDVAVIHLKGLMEVALLAK